MTEFDDLFREVAVGWLDEQFGETIQAKYYDGTGTLVGSYTVLLGPVKGEEGGDERGYRARYSRRATINKAPGWDFAAAPIEITGTLVITEGDDDVTYAIAEIVGRSEAAVSVTLRRTGAVRRRVQGE